MTLLDASCVPVDGDRIQEIALWLRLDFRRKCNDSNRNRMRVRGQGGGAANDSTENVAHLAARANVSSGGCNAVRDLGKLVEEILWPTVIVSL